jgi:protein-S-isoprenylcysteine O-methyltransferase Ste14
MGLIPHYAWRYIELFPESWIGYAAGLPLLLVGTLILIWGVRTMRRSGENISVDTPTRSIVSSGPYAFSRNPLYLSMTGAYVAITLMLNTAWPLFLLPIMLTILQLGVILREERYLGKLFGEDYRGYQAQVRRWL